MNMNQSMDISKQTFMDWFEAISRNRYGYVQMTLQDLSEMNRNVYVNGDFSFVDGEGNTETTEDKKALSCQFRSPICVAAVFNAKETLRLLLLNGGVIHKLDIGENNILHALVYSEALQPGNQSETFDVIMGYLSEDIELRRQLILSENKNGRRPLELATELGAFTMARKILSVDGVYRFPRFSPSLRLEVLYDVTDYETFGRQSRRLLSPLQRVCETKMSQLQQEQFQEFYNLPFIQSWLLHKHLFNRFVMVMWLLIRVVYHISFLMLNPLYTQSCGYQEGRNTTVPMNNSSEFSTIIGVFSSGILIFGAFSVLKWVACNVHNLKPQIKEVLCLNRVVSTVIPKLLLIFQALLWFFVIMLVKVKTCSINMYALLYIATNFINIFNFLHCLKTFPVIGHFIITFYALLLDMLNFLLLFGFVHCTLTVTTFYTFVLFDNVDSSYQSIVASFYTNFKVMLNMVNYDKYANANWGTIALLHIIIVMVMAIILINFAIAIMSNTVTAFFKHKQEILELHRINLSLDMEDNVTQILHSMLRQIKPRVFTQKLTIMNDRIYVTCFETHNITTNLAKESV